MAEQFYTILTDIGKAKIANSTAQGTKLNLTTFKVGDGGGSYYNPTENQKELKNVVWEGNLSSVKVDEENPNWIVLQSIIQAEHGGFIIREAGVYDDTGELIAIGKYPETYKPLVTEGSSKDLIIKMVLEVSNTSSVTLKVDDTIVLATKKELEILSLEIDAVQANINNMKIGVRNLIKGSEPEQILQNTKRAYDIYETPKSVINKTCTIAFDAKTSNGTDKFYISFADNLELSKQIIVNNLTPTTEYKRYSFTVKANNDVTITKLLIVNLVANIPTNTGTLSIKNIMLVEGNKALEDWIPAPEDVKHDPIGVRNLVSNGDFTKGLKGWDRGAVGTIWKVVKDVYFSYIETSKDYIRSSTVRFDLINKGDYVTVSFRARQSTGTLFSPSFKMTDAYSTNPLSDKILFALTTEWKNYSFTFKSQGKGDSSSGLFFYTSGDDTKLLQITDIKVELGTHPTSCIPSTEDINEVIALKENGGLIGTVNIAYGGTGLDVIETSKPYMRFNTNSNGAKGAILESTTFRPNSSGENSLNLGSVSLPWEMIYGKNLNLGGTLTTDTTSAPTDVDYLRTTKPTLSIGVSAGSGLKSVIIDQGGFRPSSSLAGAYDLGVSAYPWNIIYGNILKLGGTLELKSLSSTVDTINTSKGYLCLNAGSKGVVVDEVANALRPGSGSQDSMSLGTAAFPFKDLFIGTHSPSLINGYTRLPNGNIMQWGEITCKVKVGTEYTTPITFPIAFPNKPYSIIAVAKYNSRVGGTAGIGSVIVNARSTMANKTGADIITGAINSAGLSTVDNDILIGWVSIGH